MQWSKLKKRIESNFAESIQGRIEVFTTAYRRQDEMARSWIVIDGKQEVSLTDRDSADYLNALFHELTPTDCLTHPAIVDEERDPSLLHEPGEFSSYDFKIMAFESLNRSAMDCLNAEHPLLRCFGVLHRKTGIKGVRVAMSDPHPLVRCLARFRCQAELANRPL